MPCQAPASSGQGSRDVIATIVMGTLRQRFYKRCALQSCIQANGQCLWALGAATHLVDDIRGRARQIPGRLQGILQGLHDRGCIFLGGQCLPYSLRSCGQILAMALAGPMPSL